MIGFSSDGDTRLLSSMVQSTKLNVSDAGASGDDNNATQLPQLSFYCMQDAVHKGTKLRNRLLVPSIHLPLGASLISISHLKLLINKVPKEQHGLVLSDICPNDRQNFGSLPKMMHQRVIDSLKKHIIGSEGTVMYLKICAEITSSLIDEDMQPEDRIYTLLHATFFIRAWRAWLNIQSLNLAENFITNNAYTCLEINAANLILLARKF